MVEHIAAGSILVLDWGSVETKAFLIDRVNSLYRLVARGHSSTFGPYSEEDPTIGFQAAISQIEEATGRTLLNREGLPIMPEQEATGVDIFAAASSYAPPLRVMLVGLSDELSIAEARKALNSYYTVEAGYFSFLAEPDRSRRLSALLKTFMESQPDLVLMVGGTDDGAAEPLLELARMLAVAYSLWQGETPPPLVFAGNNSVADAVREILGNATTVHVCENVLPSLEERRWGSLLPVLEELYQGTLLGTLHNSSAFSSLLPSGTFTSTASAFALMMRFLKHFYGLEKGIIGVDLGGRRVTSVGVASEGFSMTVREGVGFNEALLLLEEGRPEKVQRWIPFEVTPERIAEIILERHLRPATLPETREEYVIETAVIRELLIEALEPAREQWKALFPRLNSLFAPEVDLIVATGGVLSALPAKGDKALILLDSLQPAGIVNLAVDPLGLTPALGALASISPKATIHVLQKDAIAALGTVVAPIGTAPDGETAMRLQIQFDDGRSLDVEVPAGAIEVVPLPPERKARLKISLSRHFVLSTSTEQRSASVEVQGGSVGIILDARGRPLRIPESPEERIEKLQKWQWEIG